LLPQDYHYAELREMPVPPFGRTVRYRKEALLTDAFLAIAQDLKYGRIEVRNDQKVIDSLALNVLESALSTKKIREFLESQEPGHPQYRLLKSSLREMLNKLDSSDRRVLLSGVTYDSVAEHKKIQLVEVNMERWRSESAEFGDRYIWINVPSYQLQVVEGNQRVLESRIIVGHPDTPTPTLSSTVESISFYPYWHVPRKIAVEELLPAIKQDSSYLRRNDFEVLDKNGAVRNPATLDWKKFNKDYFPFSLRQREGTRNSLGIIKFVFDNPYAVFLHDTNAKGLFRRNVRALSHGCIRMEKAAELARYLVPEPGTIDKRIQEKKQITLGVRRPVPIYVRYFTCESRDDAPTFYDDIYGLDRAIIKSLYNPDRAKSSTL
jgi:L,D-transpeptidase YcbB